jgi:hypothetical protein
MGHDREQYALLIVAPLFWIFGYWGVVGAARHGRRAAPGVEGAGNARSREGVIALVGSADAEAAIVKLIADENHIPRFLARRILKIFTHRLGVE